MGWYQLPYTMGLDESWWEELDKIIDKQWGIETHFDQTTHNHMFEKGDLVLLWDKKNEISGKHGKFDSLWLGPYIIDEKIGRNSFTLTNLEHEKLPLRLNGKHIKLYYLTP